MGACCVRFGTVTVGFGDGGRVMRDERGELRGLLIVLGLVMALGAVVFGFNLRAHKSEPTAAAVTAVATTTTIPGAPTTTAAPADAGAPADAAPVAAPSAAATPGGGPAPTAPRTAPPVTSAPVTAPPATSPPATSPPATAPPTTVRTFTCTASMSDPNPPPGGAETFTVVSNSPNAVVPLGKEGGSLRMDSSGVGRVVLPSGSVKAGQTVTMGVAPDRAGVYACQASFTVKAA